MSDEYSKFITDSCSLEKIVSSIGELFEELELYGVPSLPDTKETNPLCLKEATILLKSLVNASYHMLHRHRKVLHEYEELEMKRMRDNDDNRALKVTINFLDLLYVLWRDRKFRHYKSLKWAGKKAKMTK